MGEQYLIHDNTWLIAMAVLELFNLREEERREAFPLVYERVKEGLERYSTAVRRERRRLFGPPSANGGPES